MLALHRNPWVCRMAQSGHSPPTSADDWIGVARRELRNLRGAYIGQLSNDAKVDHALKATEAVLKAIIWKQHGWSSWPGKTKGYKFLYNHDLQTMLDHCGSLRSRLRLSAHHWISWQVLANAVLKQSRYSPTPPPDAEAHEVAKSARHPDKGIVPWLLARYHEMT